MIQFTNPVWLWALSGLLIPVAIHLLSQKEGKVIYMGSVRHLRETETAQFRSIRLNEIVLLLLRSLLILLLVLMLAGTKIKTGNLFSKKWLLIESGIEKEKDLKPLLDSLSKEGYETHYLAKGFPVTNENIPSSSQDYRALIDILRSKQQQEIVVISYSYVKGFKGIRTTMPANIRWITHDPEEENFYAKAAYMPNDSLWIRTGKSSAQTTSLETHTLHYPPDQKYFTATSSGDSVVIDTSDSISICIFSDDEFKYDSKIMQAGLAAIQTIVPCKISITSRQTAEYKKESPDWIIWLSDDEFPASITQPSIVYRSCIGTTRPMLIAGTSAGLFCNNTAQIDWVLTKRLTEESVLNENIIVKLATIIMANRSVDLNKQDNRVMPSVAMWSSADEKQADGFFKTSLSAIDTYLAILLLLALVAERWMAFNRNQ